MHHANHFYGHAHVLAAYCGLDPEDPPRIDGYLQHGWNVADGLGVGTPYAPGRAIFVWSEQTRRRAWSMGRRNVTVTGAPFLYLLHERLHRAQRGPGAHVRSALLHERLHRAQRGPGAHVRSALSSVPPPDNDERAGTIWYPFHGWEGQHVSGDHQRLIDEIRATEPGDVTACLYWHEFRDHRIRRTYEAAGFRVICHGYRGLHWRDTDTRFLHRQLDELRRHRRIASNRLGSAVLYGAVAGCEPAVYGDPMRLADEDQANAARIRRQWPELHGVAVDPAVAREIAAAELGADAVAGPAELRAVLGWT